MCQESSNYNPGSLYQKIKFVGRDISSVLVLNFCKNLFRSTSFRTKMDTWHVKRKHEENTEAIKKAIIWNLWKSGQFYSQKNW